MHEEIKKKQKQKREKERTKAFEANIKHNIYIYISFIWLFVLEWYPLEVKENLNRAQEQVSCKCLHQYSRIVAL